MDTANLFTYLVASVLLTLAPGPDILFVITQGISHGKRPAVLTALGLCSGIIVHTTAAALGVSAIFYSSALAFQILKYAGAAYLLFLAWKTIRRRGGLSQSANAPRLRGATLFRRGFIMNVLNPKVSLFFLAFLPQFVHVEAGSIPLQMMLLGFVFMLQAIVIFSTVGICAGAVGRYLFSQPRLVRGLDWMSAVVFAGLGIRLALVER